MSVNNIVDVKMEADKFEVETTVKNKIDDIKAENGKNDSLIKKIFFIF